MKKIWFYPVFLGLVILTIMGTAHAQKQPKTLSILYTNNVNGEIDPCPS